MTATTSLGVGRFPLGDENFEVELSQSAGDNFYETRSYLQYVPTLCGHLGPPSTPFREISFRFFSEVLLLHLNARKRPFLNQVSKPLAWGDRPALRRPRSGVPIEPDRKSTRLNSSHI